MIATDYTSLLQHLRTERGPVRFEDLLADCKVHPDATFPKTPEELDNQF